MSENLIGTLPLWGLFIVTVMVTYLALLAGFLWGSKASSAEDTASVPPISSVVASMLALLAFILALTFNSATSRYEGRKNLLLEDANAIGTVYLRADFLTPDDRDKTRQLLRRYLELRLQVPLMPDKLGDLLNQSEQVQQQLWRIAVSYSQSDGKSASHPALIAQFVAALNEMFDIHSKRVVYGTQYRIHSTIWYSLFGVGILSLGALGFQFGISGGRRYQISLLLALCFSTILLLILDLDRPVDGSIQVSQAPLLKLQESMQ